MVKRTNDLGVDGAAKAEPEDVGQSDDGAAPPEQAPASPADASDANSDGTSTEGAQVDDIDWSGTPPASAPERPAVEDEAPAQLDDAGPPDGDAATPVVPSTTTANAVEAGGQPPPPPAEEFDEDEVEDQVPAVEPSEPWPEQWGAPSQSNVLKVLGKLMSQVEGSREKASILRPEGAEPDSEQSAAGHPTWQNNGVSQTSQPGKQLADVTVEEDSPGVQRLGAAPANRRSGFGLHTILRRQWSFLTNLVARLGKSSRADGQASSGRVRPRAGRASPRARRPERALRDPATNPTDISRRRSLGLETHPDRGFAPGRRHSQSVPPPVAPLRPVLEPGARVAGPPPQATELSSLMDNQPEFQRAFGASNLQSEVSTTRPRVSAGSAISRMQSRPAFAVSLGLAVVLASAYAIYSTQIGEPPANVEADVVEAVPVESATTSAPAIRPAIPPTDAPGLTTAPALTTGPGFTIAREVPVSIPSQQATNAFRQPVETDGAPPTIQIHPTIAISPTAGPGAGASDAALDLDARKAVKLLLEFNVGEAETLVSSVLARNPRHLGGLIGRGRVDLLRSDFVAAESVFQQVLRDNPQSLVARLGLAEAFLGQWRSAEALAILNAVVTAAPDVAAAYDLRARGFAQSGNLKSMQSDCQTLAARAGAKFVGQWCEGLGYKDAGAKAEAVTALTSAVGSGSVEFLRHRQSYLKFRGHYSGEVDGEFGPTTRQAITACVEDPNC